MNRLSQPIEKKPWECNFQDSRNKVKFDWRNKMKFEFFKNQRVVPSYLWFHMKIQSRKYVSKSMKCLNIIDQWSLVKFYKT